MTGTQLFNVVIDGDDGGVDMLRVCERVNRAFMIRSKYKTEYQFDVNLTAKFPPSPTITVMDGIYTISDYSFLKNCNIVPWSVFASDAEKVLLTIGNSICARACAHRIKIIQERSKTFFLLNAELPKLDYKNLGGTLMDYIKVDNSVKLSKALCAQELLDLVTETYHRFPEEIIGRRLDKPQETLTFRELFEINGINDLSVLSVEALGWQPSHKARTRSKEESPLFGLSNTLLKAFLYPNGAFAAETIKTLLSRNELNSDFVQATEYKVSVYAINKEEIGEIANFMRRNSIGPHKNNMWIIQLRLYDNPEEGVVNECSTIQDRLDAIFIPLINATLKPEDARNASTAWFLSQVGAFLLESSNTDPSAEFERTLPLPSEMDWDSNPGPLYYAYYIFSNLNVLNCLRKQKGMNTFYFRVSGANMDLNTVVAAYMFADVITQVRLLHNFPVAEYLIGMHRIGVTVSPLYDNDQPDTPYRNHPLTDLLHLCLTVSFSTEKPLLFHHDHYPLREEYATARKLFRLSMFDIAELSRNSVQISCFNHNVKQEWLGDISEFSENSKMKLNNVLYYRIAFREDAWRNEKEMLNSMIKGNLISMQKGIQNSTGMNSASPLSNAATQSKWHHLSSVIDLEYFTVLDSRIRFPRTVISGPRKDDIFAKEAGKQIANCLKIREKYRWKKPNPWEVNRKTKNLEADFQRRTATFNEDDWTYSSMETVYISYKKGEVHSWPKDIPTLEEFRQDIEKLRETCNNAEVNEFSQRRLELLDHKFSLHLALNHAKEAGMTDKQASTNRDIYQAIKVDTHIHMAAGMSSRQLLAFILRKLNSNPDDIVAKNKEEILTLRTMMKNSGINQNLTVDQLKIAADHTLFQRFDNFNNRYNPMGNGALRTLLLKTDNFMNGRYFAEIIHDCFDLYSRDQATFAENRVSIYGINLKEWEKLSSWFDTHGMSSLHNKWIIQVPRVYQVFRGLNVIGSFGQYLQNIFEPLWEASLHPSEHPSLHNFLNHVSGFDSVDNEAKIDLPFSTLTPWEWTAPQNPPYNYYIYYLYANIRTLNQFRAARGFSTFDLRPHCGESGGDDHLFGAFFCADGIAHGINLKNNSAIQYMYYLVQIALHVSPLSNNALFLRFKSNPFPQFFKRGLNVSLSTDDPMMFHNTQEPLIEEYSVAARVWGFSPNDLCEIARNSVLQSGYDYEFKRQAIGDRWFMSSSLSNDPRRTHLSDIRVAYRFETYHTEVSFIETLCGCHIERAMLTLQQEHEINVKLQAQNGKLGRDRGNVLADETINESEDDAFESGETIILSTHDNCLEEGYHDIEKDKTVVRDMKVKVDSLREQQRALVASITDIAVKRKFEDEKAIKAQTKLAYTRENGVSDSKLQRALYRVIQDSQKIINSVGTEGNKSAPAKMSESHVIGYIPPEADFRSENQKSDEEVYSDLVRRLNKVANVRKGTFSR